jgi:DNA-binding SARP family transcriptional activator/DNA-binding beta-propeller fold protein YncE
VRRFRLLGPFEAVADDGTIVPLRTKPRALLAALLLSPGSSISAQSLVDAVWGETAPASARDLIRLYVSQLRESLGESAVETRPGGYAVPADTTIDSTQFNEAIEEGRAARDAGNLEVALDAYDRGLALWVSDSVLPDTPLEGDAHIAAGLLEEQRLAAVEERFEVAMSVGATHELVGHLEGLVKAHPARERLRGLLMLALYRSGRQAEALATYRQGRQYLSDEFGLEPASELRDLERAILQQNPSLDVLRQRRFPQVDPADTVARSPWRRRRTMLTITAAAVVAGAIALTAVSAETGHRNVIAHPNSILALDPHTGHPKKTLAIPGVPVAAGTGGGLLLVGTAAQTLLEINPRNDRLVATVGLPATPRAVVYAAGRIWVSNAEDATLTRVGPGQLVSPPETPEPEAKGPLSLTPSVDGLWVGSFDNAITRLSTEGGATTSFRAVQPHALATAFGSLWVAQATRVTVRRIDLRTSRATLIPVGGPTSEIAASASAVWALGWSDATLWRIDPRTDAVVASIPVAPDASAIVTIGNTVWVVAATSGGLQQIDPRTNRVGRTIELKRAIGAVTADRNTLWLGIR